MPTTRTGNFPIGFRRLIFSPWQKDAPALIAWAKKENLSVIDLGKDADASAQPFLHAGFRIGSADLPEWPGLLSSDPARRENAIAKNLAYIKTCSSLGIHEFFLVMLPEDPNSPRKNNFANMVESFNAMAHSLEQQNARLVIEGWPGPGALCCTPETVRAMLKACSTKNVGLNYDPSHLIRMHIDPLRFLEEFADRVYHVHGKDTEILAENQYEYGSEQPPTFGKSRDFGSVTWRYTIPGHGAFRWTRALEILASRGYTGSICVELEDENFNGSESGEKQGIISGVQFLSTC